MEPAGPDDAIYSEIKTEDGPRMQPSALATGPWNAAHQHGGPVAGVLTRALDGIPAPAPMRLTRITVEMFRGVPLTPLRVATETLRAGRRIQSVEARLYAGPPSEEVLVARATGLRIRRSEDLQEMETEAGRDPALGDPPDQPMKRPPMDEAVVPNFPGFARAVDIHVEPPTRPGEPASVWTRLLCRFKAGEETPPIVQLASLCDFASGTGNVMDYGRYTSINPDLTIHVLREPRSDWIGIRGITHRAGDGIGQSFARIFDLEGEIAQVQASLLLDRRPS